MTAPEPGSPAPAPPPTQGASTPGAPSPWAPAPGSRTIGFLGTGGIATAIAGHLVRAGHHVIMSNSRGPESLAPVIEQLGPGARAGSRDEAAGAEMVVLAVPWNAAPDALAGLAPWEGRIIIDATNPLVAPTYEPADLGGRTSSEITADLVPGARLVKAFNTIATKALAADPHQADGDRVIVLSGDDHDAKVAVAELVGSMGFFPIDLGGLVAGGSLHQVPGGPLALNMLRVR